MKNQIAVWEAVVAPLYIVIMRWLIIRDGLQLAIWYRKWLVRVSWHGRQIN